MGFRPTVSMYIDKNGDMRPQGYKRTDILPTALVAAQRQGPAEYLGP